MKTKDIIQQEAFEAIGDSHNSCCVMSMGTGKSKLGLMWADKHFSDYLKALVAVPKLTAIQSWKDDMVRFGYQHLLDHIDFTTYVSLPKQRTDYDLFIADEVHNILPSHESWLNTHKGKKLGLTGTIPPDSVYSEKARIIKEHFPAVYNYGTDQAVEDDILNDYKVVIYMLDLDSRKNIKVEKSGKIWYTSELDTYNYWTNRVNSASSRKETQITAVMRMKALQGFKSKEVLATNILAEMDSDVKCLLFANTKKQADSFQIRSYHSSNPSSEQNLEMFKKGDITSLSCVLQLSEGVNIPHLQEGIVLHAYGNERKLAQRFGRLLRLDPGETATLRVLCYRNTVDENWVGEAIKDLNSSKITWIEK